MKTQRDAPAFDFYPERWIAGTMGMTNTEELCYFRLLIHSWIADGLPPEVKNLCRLARMKLVSEVVLEKFPIWPDGKRRNNRLEHERKKQRERIAKKRGGALLTNAKRWPEGSLSDQIATPKQVASESPPPTTHHPPHDPSDHTPKVPKGDGPGYSAAFEEFWSVYPNKVGKLPAWKAWKRIHPRPTRAELASAVARHRMTERWRSDHGQYIPNPSTWLNERRWEDEGLDLTPDPNQPRTPEPW